NVARKAVNYMKSTGIADTAYFGPELEFFVFDSIRYDQTQNSGYYFIDSIEGAWNTGREKDPDAGGEGRPNPRHKRPSTGRLFPRAPARSLARHPLRNDADHDPVRPQDRSPASRGGIRWPGRNRHGIRAARRDGRQRPQVQVHHQERGQEVRQDSHLHAQAN